MILFSGIAYLYFSSWYFLQKTMRNNLEIVMNKRMLNLLKPSPYILHNCPGGISVTNAFLKKVRDVGIRSKNLLFIISLTFCFVFHSKKKLRVTIGFSFESDWLRGLREFCDQSQSDLVKDQRNPGL